MDTEKETPPDTKSVAVPDSTIATEKDTPPEVESIAVPESFSEVEVESKLSVSMDEFDSNTDTDWLLDATSKLLKRIKLKLDPLFYTIINMN